MQVYLDCLRKNSNSSTPCRHLNKDYLECRMARCAPAFPSLCIRGSDRLTCEPSGLMERDEWKNLGLSGVGEGGTAAVAKDNPKDKPRA